MQQAIDEPVIVLVGPTAIGKTDLSLHIAEKFHCEIVSLDSMQVYRFMDIGTAKVSKEEQLQIPHHLIDIVNPEEEYNAKIYAEDATLAIKDIHTRGNIPLVTGGTGLYLRSLTDGLFKEIGDFPELRKTLNKRLENEGSLKLHQELALRDNHAASSIHHNDSQRILRGLEIVLATGIPWSEHIANQQKTQPFKDILQIGLTDERESLYHRINERTKLMLKSGFEEEVRWLLHKGYSRELKSMQSIGYKHMVSYILDGWSREETERLLARDTRRYAKRQYTWFRRSGVQWFHIREKKDIFQCIEHFLGKNR